VSIGIRNVSKSFGGFAALDDVSLTIPTGGLVALLGPSGSGKTTLLRIVAGLETADRGAICFEDEDVTDIPARDRQVGFVFQHYALFRHMTVFENVAFGLRVRRVARSEVAARVEELLRLVRLEGLGHRHPSELSGGQRQRVALARALAPRPRMLLLDEPFGALDAKVRQELRTWLRTLHDETRTTTVFVTHDQEEAFEVADRVVVMRAGRVEQVGSPQEVFDRPATPFVMDFLGHVNVFHGRVHGAHVDLGVFRMAFDGVPRDEPWDATAYVRPDELSIDREPHGASPLAVRVLQSNPAGSLVKVRVRSDEHGIELVVDIGREHARQLGLEPGDRAFVTPRSVRIFEPVDYAI
jgi:sulfate transport system ATP-binding protein